jgi:hypothetical protein
MYKIQHATVMLTHLSTFKSKDLRILYRSFKLPNACSITTLLEFIKESNLFILSKVGFAGLKFFNK